MFRLQPRRCQHRPPFQQVGPCPRGHLILGRKGLHRPAPTHLSKLLYGSYSALCPEVPTKCLLSTQSLYVGKQSFYKEQVLLCSPAQWSLRRPTYGSPEAVLLLNLTIPLRKGGGGHSYQLPTVRRPRQGQGIACVSWARRLPREQGTRDAGSERQRRRIGGFG